MTSALTPDSPEMSRPCLVGVVDDDASLLRALGRLLRTAGFTVATFGSAEEYLAASLGATVGCLVLDIHLGGLSGFGLQDQMRGRGLAIPTIFMTAQDEPATRERARSAGAAAYLLKPFDARSLISAVTEALATH